MYDFKSDTEDKFEEIRVDGIIHQEYHKNSDTAIRKHNFSVFNNKLVKIDPFVSFSLLFEFTAYMVTEPNSTNEDVISNIMDYFIEGKGSEDYKSILSDLTIERLEDKITMEIERISEYGTFSYPSHKYFSGINFIVSEGLYYKTFVGNSNIWSRIGKLNIERV